MTPEWFDGVIIGQAEIDAMVGDVLKRNKKGDYSTTGDVFIYNDGDYVYVMTHRYSVPIPRKSNA